MTASSCVLASWLLFAAGACAPAAFAQQPDEFPPVEKVFTYTAASDGGKVTVHWSIEPGYYLYQSRMKLATTTPGYALGEPVFPRAEIHEDEYFGKQEIFRGAFAVTAALTTRPPAAATIALQLKLQGCADAGLCYPPQTWVTQVTVPAAAGNSAASPLAAVLDQLPRHATSSEEFLPVDEAFRAAAVAEGPDRVRLYWEIAPGYYLYKSRFKVAAQSTRVELGRLDLPAGESHEDEFFGRQEIYRNEVIATLPVSRPAGSALTVPLALTYQGCADAGLCYPPTIRTLNVELPAGVLGTATPAGTRATGFLSEQDRLSQLLRSGNLFYVLALFFAGGLALAFTPCVLPMVAILSSIIVGQRERPPVRRAFALSLAYVLGMSVVYTAAGVLAALAGKQVQALFQQPWVIGGFAALFAVLALSMFGLFTIQMPATIQSRVSTASNRLQGGTYLGVAVMGALSSLIVTACVAPVLVASLAVIGQAGDVLRGATALFATSLGMGVPLLIVGASAGKLLPQAGPWMDTVKQGFGVLLLAVAAWILARIVPDRVVLLLWTIPAFSAGWVFWIAAKRVRSSRWLLRAISVAASSYAAVLIVGATLGGTDPLAPIPQLTGRHAPLAFRRIKTVADLESELAAASRAGKPVLLDFYADWCVSCKELEKYTFSDGAVQATLAAFVLLRADVTANDGDDAALLQRLGVFGPPTVAFFGADGRERRNYRIVGFMRAREFASVANQLRQSAAPARSAPAAGAGT
jgi:thiol:disulfide interchange protein DsbD